MTVPVCRSGVREPTAVGAGVIVCTRSDAVWNVPLGSGAAPVAHAVATITKEPATIARSVRTRAESTDATRLPARGSLQHGAVVREVDALRVELAQTRQRRVRLARRAVARVPRGLTHQEREAFVGAHRDRLIA